MAARAGTLGCTTLRGEVPWFEFGIGSPSSCNKNSSSVVCRLGVSMTAGKVNAVIASNRIRVQRLLREAEGYLELGLPQQALNVLAGITDPGTSRGHLLQLRGEALRAQEQWPAAATALQQAADLMPSNIPCWLSLGWCLKRAGQLDLAIHALEQARESDAAQAIVHYNLACYMSLAGRKDEALHCLSQAIQLQPEVRDLVNDESDFDPIRSDPEFQALTSIIV